MATRKAERFEMQIQDVTMQVTAPRDLYEESRASAMHFWDVLQSFAARSHEFRASARPLALADDAPEPMRRIAEQAAAAGVGPKFAFKGALTDHLGAFLSQRLPEVVVASTGGYYVVAQRRTKLTVFRGEDPEDGFAVGIDPALGPLGIYTTMGRTDLPTHNVDGLVVLAGSCALADAAATYALGLMDRPDGFAGALAYLQGVDGLRGAVAIQDGRIGMAGAVEIAA